MQLLLLVLILLGPYALLWLAGAGSPALRLDHRIRARVALSIFFAFTGIGHFIKTDALVSMMPAALPYRLELVYLTGIFELLGAAGIWVRQVRKLTGWCLIVMLVAFLPVNIYAALQRIGFGGHELGPLYLLARVPVQLLLIAWTWFATEPPARRRPH
jgi:uncharacterized membrane protein